MTEDKNILLQAQLLNRRHQLRDAIDRFENTSALYELLREVDAALQRMEHGAYGVCEICCETIEEERLIADPLARTCLDHLTPAERAALENDLTLAASIQQNFLPKRDSRFAGWQVSYHYEPIGAVSGDFCDLISLDTGQPAACFLIGDVSGKGLAASMLMAHLHAVFRSLIEVSLPVNQLVQRANHIFCESTTSMHFATLVMGRLGESGDVEIANAGHCRPLLIRQGRVTSIEATGLPVGISCHEEYAIERTHLARGDTLFLYTDGLTEALNMDEVEYGVERLVDLIRGRHALSPRALIAECLDDLSAFCSGQPRADDLTIMVIRRTE